MKRLAKSLVSLGEMIKESDIVFILKTLDGYEEIPRKYKNIDFLRKELKKRFPQIFARGLGSGREKELPLRELKIMEKPRLLSRLKFEPKAIGDFLGRNERKIKDFRKKIRRLFSGNGYNHSFRIKDPESLLLNLKKHGEMKASVDIVGIRVVPKDTTEFFDMIREIEKVLRDEISFKLNTIAYSEKEIVNKLGKFSIYYRAIHYYFKLDSFYIELQIRSPWVDQWSILHHSTVYKPQIQVTAQEKKDIMEFGKISNIIDYYKLLGKKIFD